MQYILATGDFTEPETRVPFSDEDLARLDYKVKCIQVEDFVSTEILMISGKSCQIGQR